MMSGRTSLMKSSKSRQVRRRSVALRDVVLVGIILISVLMATDRQQRVSVVDAAATTLSSSSTSRRLVVIAGPHGSGSTSTYQFLDQYATRYNDDGEANELPGWTWPTLPKEDLETIILASSSDGRERGRHDIFDHLIMSPDNSELQKILIQSIRDAWMSSTYGVLVGSDDFERAVATTTNTVSYRSSTSAVSTVLRIKENLSIVSNEDVTIVLLYPRRRVDQLNRIWDHQPDSGSYEEFICSVQEGDLTWNYLDLSMNPLRIATEYRRAGFKVILVDTERIRDVGGDVTHAIMCTLPGTECFDDRRWITSLHDVRTPAQPPISKMIEDELDEEPINDLDEILRQRDCYWSNELAKDPSFYVLNGQGPNYRDATADFFSDCGRDTRSEIKYSQTNFLLFALQRQLDCQSDSLEPNESDLAEQSAANEGSGSNKTTNSVLLILVGVLLIIPLYLCYCMFYRRRCSKSKDSGADDGLFQDDDLIKLPRMPFTDEIPNLPFPSPSKTDKGRDAATNSADGDVNSVWVSTRSLMTGVVGTSLPRFVAKSHESSPGGLCKACKMVGIDPKCPFCQGGEEKSTTTAHSPKSVMMADELSDNSADDLDDILCVYCMSGVGAPNPECATCSAGQLTSGNGYNDLHERWHSQVRPQSVIPSDLEARQSNSCGENEKSRTEPSKSRAMSKLKELRGLKEAELL